jgi:hypothetical protein
MYEYYLIAVILVLIVVLFMFSGTSTSTSQTRPVPSDNDYMSKCITVPAQGTATVKLFVPQGFCCGSNVYIIPTENISGEGQLSSMVGSTKGDNDVSVTSVLFSGTLNSYENAYGIDSFSVRPTCSPSTDKFVYITLTSTYATSIKVIVRNELQSIYSHAD